MNNTPVFNFIDFYKFNGTLIFHKTTSVYDFNIVMDNVSGQTSTIRCSYVDISTGDYGILRNNNKQVLIFKIVDIQTDKSDSMELTILSGLDLIDLYSFIPVSESVISIENLVNLMNYDITNISTNGNVSIPFTYSGDVISMNFQNTSDYFIKHSDLIKKVIRSSNVTYKIQMDEAAFTEYGIVSLDISLTISEPKVLGLNIMDTNAIADYTIHRSPSDFNILQMLILNIAGDDYYDWYYRIKEDGNVYMYDGADTFLVDSNGVLTTTSILWDEDCIYPEKIKSEFLDEESSSEEVTPEQAAALTLKNASITAYSLLKEQFYNHEIDLVCYFDNDKIDFSDLSEVFNTLLYLNLDGTIITTSITRYEYAGDDLVRLKLGSARGNLTDKLRMKGVL